MTMVIVVFEVLFASACVALYAGWPLLVDIHWLATVVLFMSPSTWHRGVAVGWLALYEIVGDTCVWCVRLSALSADFHITTFFAAAHHSFSLCCCMRFDLRSGMTS